MQAGYFKTAWNDIRNSPKWFSKLLLLGLISLIPVFGAIVVMGYLYGWARDIAWNVHAPMPARIFGNEDGKLYSRGFFVLVVSVVFSCLPMVIDLIGVLLGAGPVALWGNGHHARILSFLPVVTSLFLFVATIAAIFFVQFFTWVGSMRISIYGRLSAGFQLGKIWSMMRRDFNGLLRIFGMALIAALVVGAVFAVLVGIVSVIFGISAAALAGGVGAGTHLGGSVPWGAIFALGGLALLVALAVGYALSVASVFISAIVARAMGYWTRQFDVPAWRGQDDPLPFEVRSTQPGTPK